MANPTTHLNRAVEYLWDLFAGNLGDIVGDHAEDLMEADGFAYADPENPTEEETETWIRYETKAQIAVLEEALRQAREELAGTNRG